MRTLGLVTKLSVSLASVALVTVGFAPFADTVNHTTVALTYLLAVLFVATLFGSRPAMLSSVAAALCFNFFFLPPYYTLAVTQSENWVALAAFLITALVAGQLSSYARRRADESEDRRREIEKLYRELRDAFAQASQAEALKQSEQMKSALLDAVTHDLRTPLTSIKAAATTLMETGIDLEDDSRHDLLAIIDEETDRLNKFIGGLVDLARIEAGKLDLRRSEVPVADVISQAIERAGIRLSGRNIVIEVPEAIPALRVDGLSVEESLFSLIENAAKYSPAGTDIRVAAHSDDDGNIIISVEDKGRGIAPVDRDRIFEKFVRVPDASLHTTAGGLGFGLAIARGLAQSESGDIEVTDGSDGYVTAFKLKLPAVKAATQ